MRRQDKIQYKTADQLKLMRKAGLLVADALEAVAAAIAPGLSTGDLDKIAEDTIRSAGGVPSFVGYHGYPATLCVSVNEEIVHGIPGSKVLAAGDVVSVDCGAIVDGWHGDAAFTAIVPGVEPNSVDVEMSAVCERSMWAGIAAIREGGRLNDVGAAIEESIGESWGIVEEYGGHGIGTEMHQEPHVLNYRTSSRGPKLRAGLCLAIEPMITVGDARTRVLADEWTVVSVDGTRAAHWEHSAALHEGGLWVLTARDGGEAGLAGAGVKFAPLAD